MESFQGVAVASAIYGAVQFFLHRFEIRWNVAVFLSNWNNRFYGGMNAIFLLWAVLVLSRSLSEKSSLFGLPLCGRVHEETKDALFRPYFYSKVYEYLDIVFVALRGYPINTHFRFHHNTTLLLAYSLLVGRNRAGVWFMLSNVFMHFLLYPYLGGWAQWHSWIRKMGHVQLVVGILVSAISLLERSRGADCGGSSILDLICLVLYSSYMVLFRLELMDLDKANRKAKQK